MAIKKREDKKTSNVLPGDLDNMVHKAFTEQFLSSKYEELFKDSKAEVLKYIESSDEIEITQGEGFKTEYGSIILSQRTTCKIDKDKLAQLVADGELTVDQLLACVSTFKNEDLEKTLSSSVFNDLAEKSSSDTFTWKATTDFKAECAAQFDKTGAAAMIELKDIPAPAPKAAPKIEAKPEAKKLSVADKAKAAKARVSTKAKPDDDLDAILGKGK